MEKLIKSKKIRTTLQTVYVMTLLMLFVVAVTALVANFDFLFSKKSHDSFWESRKLFYDKKLHGCYMIFVDRFGRGSSWVDCDKLPPEVLAIIKKQAEEREN